MLCTKCSVCCSTQVFHRHQQTYLKVYLNETILRSKAAFSQSLSITLII